MKRLTCGTCDHPLPLLSIVEVGHLVVGTSKLEREDRLEIFSFEKDIGLEPIAEVDCICQGRCLNDIVYFGGEDQSKILS